MYEPRRPGLAVVKSRISTESWDARVDAAHRDAAVLGAISARVEAGAALDEAIRQEVPKSRRSWVIRHGASYRREGFEALIDERVPREPRLAKESGPLIEAAREANAKVLAPVWARFIPARTWCVILASCTDSSSTCSAISVPPFRALDASLKTRHVSAAGGAAHSGFIEGSVLASSKYLETPPALHLSR